MTVVLIGFCGLIGAALGFLSALFIGAQFLTALLFSFIGYFIVGLVAVYVILENCVAAEHLEQRKDPDTKGKVGLRLGLGFDHFE